MKTDNSLYLRIWRWHFYAGLLVVPIVVLLGITGGIYILKPYVEPVMYSDLWSMPTPGESVAGSPIGLPLSQQVQAARDANPAATVTSVTPRGSDQTTEVQMRTPSHRNLLVYVNPYNAEVLGSLDRDTMLMRRVRNLHGELMLGAGGSAVVELAACWTIVLLMTGIYLWWPRDAGKIMGVWIPRLRSGGRIFWRDIHSVTAIYASGFLLVLILTGLPWSGVWGGTMKRVQQATGQNAPPAASRRARFKSDRSARPKATPLTIDEAQDRALALGIPADATIKLPAGPEGAYGFTHSPLALEESRYLYLDQYSGTVLSEASWSDYPLVAKGVTTGIRLHQGELFGLLNVIVMLMASLSLPLIAASGVVMWWQRRPKGKLAPPPLPESPAAPRTIMGITVGLGVLFPLVGASLVVVYIGEWILMRRSASPA